MPDHFPEYESVHRCVAELKEMWASVPVDLDSEEEPSTDPALGKLTAPGDILPQSWAQTPGVKYLGPRGQRILDRVRAWLRPAEESAQADHANIVALCDRWAADPAWQALRLFAEPRAAVVERLTQTVAGLAHTVHDERPEDAGTFRIDWQADGDGLGHWERQPPAPAFSLRDAAEDNAELLGEFAPPLRRAVAEGLLRALRSGELALPLLPRAERSTDAVTWLQWLPPGAPAEVGLLFLEDGPREPTPEEEVQLWGRVPELARIYEGAVVLSAQAPEVVEAEAEPGAGPPEEARAEFLTEVVGDLGRLTDLPQAPLVQFLARPLQVISQLSDREEVQRRASSLLDTLRRLFN